MNVCVLFKPLTTLSRQIFIEKTQSSSKTAPLSGELRYLATRSAKDKEINPEKEGEGKDVE